MILRAAIQNICLFVLWDTGTEAWIIRDTRHRPKLKIGSSPDIDLTGCTVRFGAGGETFPMTASRLGGGSDRYIDILRLFSDATLRPEWLPEGRMPDAMATRIALPGGTLTARHAADGDSRSWIIGSRPPQTLTSETTFERTVNGGAFVRIEKSDGSPAVQLEIPPDDKGYCRVELGAQDKTGQATLKKVGDEVYVEEVSAFDSVLDLPGGATMPLPHTTWTEYQCPDGGPKNAKRESIFRDTDPCGGPCPSGMLNLRTLPPAAFAWLRR